MRVFDHNKNKTSTEHQSKWDAAKTTIQITKHRLGHIGRSLNCLPFVSRKEGVSSAQSRRQQRRANMSEIEIRKVGVRIGEPAGEMTSG